MPKLRPITDTQFLALERSVELLRNARIHARVADCPQLLKAINHAIASAGGAVRHAKRRPKLSVRQALRHVANDPLQLDLLGGDRG